MTRDEAMILARQHGAWQPPVQLGQRSGLQPGDVVMTPAQLWGFAKAVEEAARAVPYPERYAFFGDRAP